MTVDSRMEKISLYYLCRIQFAARSERNVHKNNFLFNKNAHFALNRLSLALRYSTDSSSLRCVSGAARHSFGIFFYDKRQNIYDLLCDFSNGRRDAAVA